MNLRLDRHAAEPAAASLIGTPSTCRNTSIFFGYLRGTLFIEGLDSQGGRLFVATGFNPLHQDLEVPPSPNGGQASWHSVDTPAAVINTIINAPLTDKLARLRWYDVDENFQPHLLGEASWKLIQGSTH